MHTVRKLTEEMVSARTKHSKMSTVKKFNCWGAELTDVSVIRQFVNVEVLSLSLNSITTLADFQFCQNLVELYIRRNEIRDLSEVCYLQDLPNLRNLLLTENPCVEKAGQLYRPTVLRALPKLDILDGTPVTSEDLDVAKRTGIVLHHPMAAKESPPEPMYFEQEGPNAPGATVCRNLGPSGEATEYIRPLGECHQQTEPVMPKPEEQPPMTPNNGNTQNENSQNGYVQNPNNQPSRIESEDSHFSPGPQTQHLASSCSNSCNPEGESPRPMMVPPERGSQERGGMMDVQQRNFRQQSDYNRGQVQYHEAGPQRRTEGNLSARSESSRIRERPTASTVISAILCLISGLDLSSLEVVEMGVRRRIEDLEDQ